MALRLASLLTVCLGVDLVQAIDDILHGRVVPCFDIETMGVSPQESLWHQITDILRIWLLMRISCHKVICNIENIGLRNRFEAEISVKTYINIQIGLQEGFCRTPIDFLAKALHQLGADAPTTIRRQNTNGAEMPMLFLGISIRPFPVQNGQPGMAILRLAKVFGRVPGFLTKA